MESEQMLEGQTQVAENPHSEYGLTDSVETTKSHRVSSILSFKKGTV
uniref:Dpy-30 histone methyltransferase complex regulatory subunit n=2 Tax=Rattus norvegicus TaxID=10116 RepID=A0A0G2JXS1_RAT